jgi:hypothetical protein
LIRWEGDGRLGMRRPFNAFIGKTFRIRTTAPIEPSMGVVVSAVEGSLRIERDNADRIG